MIEYLIHPIAAALEFGGIAAITIGTLWATLLAGHRFLFRRVQPVLVFDSYREHLSRGILLGLELLVAADIVRTLVVEPSFRSVGVLGLIVVVRTFLSFTLEVEVTGRWPWQPRSGPDREPAT
jgi:uncharacterized membrane protein